MLENGGGRRYYNQKKEKGKLVTWCQPLGDPQRCAPTIPPPWKVHTYLPMGRKGVHQPSWWAPLPVFARFTAFTSRSQWHLSFHAPRLLSNVSVLPELLRNLLTISEKVLEFPKKQKTPKNAF